MMMTVVLVVTVLAMDGMARLVMLRSSVVGAVHVRSADEGRRRHGGGTDDGQSKRLPESVRNPHSHARTTILRLGSRKAFVDDGDGVTESDVGFSRHFLMVSDYHDADGGGAGLLYGCGR
jgi:hypothetical protein